MFFHYCLHKFHWKPKKYMKLNRYEKALVIASIEKKVADEKKEADKIKKKRK